MESKGQVLTETIGEEFALPYIEKKLNHLIGVALETNEILRNVQENMEGRKGEPGKSIDDRVRPEPVGMLNKLRALVEELNYLVEMSNGNVRVLATTLST